MEKIFIIAEVGPNHNGSFSMAKKLIDKISKTGADAVKFQLANPEKVYSKEAFKADYQKKNDSSKTIKEMSKKFQLSKSEHLKLSKYCEKKGIIYLCSAFDLDSLKYLVKKLRVPIIKIPSGEILSTDMLEFASKFKGQVFLSTGMSSLNDIKKSLAILKKKNIILLHCVSLYPTAYDEVNLNNLKLLRNKFKLKVGFSDHTKDELASLTAASMGISVLEKHVTLSNKMEGPDHKSSLKIEKFAKLIKKIRLIEKIKGSNTRSITNEEKKIKDCVRKSVVAKIFLPKRLRLKKKHVTFKRPGTGINPIELKFYLDKKIIKPLKKDFLLKKDNF